MRRVSALFAALGIGGVAGAVFDADVEACAFDRGAQVAADVGGQRLQRRDVEGVQAGGRGCAKFGKRGQEPGKGFAATCGGDQERGGIGCTGQHVKLVRVQVPAFGGEPVCEGGGEREHQCKIGRAMHKGKAFHLPLTPPPPIPKP